MHVRHESGPFCFLGVDRLLGLGSVWGEIPDSHAVCEGSLRLSYHHATARPVIKPLVVQFCASSNIADSEMHPGPKRLKIRFRSPVGPRFVQVCAVQVFTKHIVCKFGADGFSKDALSTGDISA